MTTPIFEGILSYSLLMVIGITVLFGLPYVYKNLYASTDLELLFTMPIPTPYIFWIKYIQSFLRVALPILFFFGVLATVYGLATGVHRSEEHTSELQSRFDLVCRLLLDKKNNI